MKILFIFSVLVILCALNVNAVQRQNQPINNRAASAQKRRPQSDAPLPGNFRRPGGRLRSTQTKNLVHVLMMRICCKKKMEKLQKNNQKKKKIFEEKRAIYAKATIFEILCANGHRDQRVFFFFFSSNL